MNFSCILHMRRKKNKAIVHYIKIFENTGVFETFCENATGDNVFSKRLYLRCCRRLVVCQKMSKAWFERNNIGAEVRSVRLAKVLNLLISLLTTCLCNAGKHVAKSGKIRQRTTEITEKVQRNYPTSTENVAVKENFVVSKVSESQPLLSKCLLRAPRFKKLTTRVLSKEMQIWRKVFPKSRVFSGNSIKRFFAQPKGDMNTQEMLRVIRRHTLEAIFEVLIVVVNYREGQKNWKNALHLKSTLAGQPIYDRA